LFEQRLVCLERDGGWKILQVFEGVGNNGCKTWVAQRSLFRYESGPKILRVKLAVHSAAFCLTEHLSLQGIEVIWVKRNKSYRSISERLTPAENPQLRNNFDKFLSFRNGISSSSEDPDIVGFAEDYRYRPFVFIFVASMANASGQCS
jgi:hypothetical protein